MAWECRHCEFAAIYGLEEVAAREAPPAVLWRCIIGDVRKDRAVDALRGAHSGIACSGTFLGGSMLLEKNANIFLCLFSMLIEWSVSKA